MESPDAIVTSHIRQVDAEVPSADGLNDHAPAVGPQRLPQPGGAFRTVLLPAGTTGFLLWASHFPLSWGWLGWVALVPLLSLMRGQRSGWRPVLASWLAGLLFFGAALQWLRLADERNYYSWPGLATYCAFYLPLAIGLIYFLDRRTRLPLIVSVPVVWTALDYLRAHLFTGFPWYFLGHTQHDCLPIIQIADLGGAYAVTFVVAAVNALVTEWLCTRRWFRRLLGLSENRTAICSGENLLGVARPEHGCERRGGQPPAPPTPFASMLRACHPNWFTRISSGQLMPPGLMIQTVTVAILMTACLVYGFWRLGDDASTPGPRIALVQGATEQRIRNAADGANVQEEADKAAAVMTRDYQQLHDLARIQKPQPDLIVWPETSHPDGWFDRDFDVANESLAAFQYRCNPNIQRLARQAQTNVLFGLNTEVALPADKRRLYNSAVLIRKEGGEVERYDKMHRVPFGEYVPLRDVLPFMNVFAPYDFDYSITAGDRFTRFDLGNYRFGVIICYEDSDPTLARQYVRTDSGAPVDFLINLSNDGWFQGSSEHEEHLAICRFRAVECRRAVLRAVNMGISAVIDGNGRVRQPLAHPEADGTMLWELPGGRGMGGSLPPGEWRDFKKVAGILTAVVPIDHRSSLYPYWGDWLPSLCWLVLGGGLIVGTIWPRNAGGQPGQNHP